MFTARYSPGLTRVLWVGWFLGALALTLAPLGRHLEYFARLGDSARYLLAVGLLLSAVGAAGYASARNASIRRWELRVLAGAVLAAALIREPLAALTLAVFTAAALGIGAWLCRLSGLDESVGFGRTGLEAAAGFAALGMLWLALAVVGRFSAAPIALIVIAALALGGKPVLDRVRALVSYERDWATSPDFASAPVGVSVFYAYLFVPFATVAALAPAIQSDAIRQHLADSIRILGSGALFTSQAEWFSYFPKGFELWLAAVQSIGGQPAAQLFNPVVFGMTLAVLYAVARACRVSRSGAVLGVALGAVTPFVHWTGAVVKNDFLYAFYHLAALWIWLRARDQADKRPLLLGAFLLAASLGVKHTAVYGVFVIGLMYLWSARRSLRLIAGMGAVTLLFGTFWYARAYVDTGSPVFPFGVSTGGEKYNVQENFVEPQLLWLDTWKEYALYPWRAHFDGGLMFESPSDNPSGILLVLFSVGWLLFRREQAGPEERALLLFCLAFYFVWGYIWGMLRYGIAAFLVLIALTAARIGPLLESRSRGVRRTAYAGLLYVFAFAVPPVMMMEVNAPQLSYLLGRIDRDAYLRAAVSGYPVMQELAKHWSPEALALSSSNIAVAYSPDPARMHYASEAETYMRGAEEYLAEYEYDFLIFPNEQTQDLAQYLAPPGPFEPVYQDEAFTLAGRRPNAPAVSTLTEAPLDSRP